MTAATSARASCRTGTPTWASAAPAGAWRSMPGSHPPTATPCASFAPSRRSCPRGSSPVPSITRPRCTRTRPSTPSHAGRRAPPHSAPCSAATSATASPPRSPPSTPSTWSPAPRPRSCSSSVRTSCSASAWRSGPTPAPSAPSTPRGTTRAPSPTSPPATARSRRPMSRT